MIKRDYWDARYAKQGRRTVGHSSFTDLVLRIKTEEIKKKYGGLFKDTFGGKKVLDFGCGWGRFSRVLTDIGAEVTGADVCLWAVEEARKYVPEGDFHYYPTVTFTALAFDGVFSWTVLQHIPPQEIAWIAHELTRVVRPCGHIILYENTSDKPDAEHIWFRPKAFYPELFRKDFKVVDAEDVADMDGTGEQHTMYLMVKT